MVVPRFTSGQEWEPCGEVDHDHDEVDNKDGGAEDDVLAGV